LQRGARCICAHENRSRKTVPTVFSDPHRALEQAEARRIVNEELDRLPQRLQAVFRLCEVEGIAQREAAKRLAIPEGSVARLRAHARHALVVALRRRGVDGALAISIVSATSFFETTAAAAAATTGVSMSSTVFSLVALPFLASLVAGPGDSFNPPPRGDEKPALVEKANAPDTVFIVMNDGNLWQQTWQERTKVWSWTSHGRPDSVTALASSTATLMNGSKAFVIDAQGRLWERLLSDGTWEWIAHGTPDNIRLVSISGSGLDDRKVFVLAGNGHCFERWWDGKSWKWADHGAPAAIVNRREILLRTVVGREAGFIRPLPPPQAQTEIPVPENPEAR
jgi:predicted DNA-binding protein (UPF0251 family)